MNNLFYLMPVLLALILLMRFVLGQASKRGPAAKYRRRPIMTENEMEFFGRLVAALPEHYIFPQVAMSALIESASTDRKQAFGDRQRIAQQRIDYVVCNKRCEVVAVVELDDRTHSKVKDKVRDGRLEQGGYRTVRFQSRQKPPAIAIRAAVLPPAVSPAGPVPAAAPVAVET
ncbi:hypothetical protein SRABI118_00867 [Massilia sp. Bi118]|uniref:DUF2726 domain-containing protein n=1 Tax=Massilia sp. Bi118 TaxID=2822346 RepID=UPI001D77FA2B|nr:DUF2726 domain-containing protein [Massilia sp. Bi118]CAH0165475.1 hypothetical protein SRABI118_00867 [Massilia sp. Bi118]